MMGVKHLRADLHERAGRGRRPVSLQPLQIVLDERVADLRLYSVETVGQVFDAELPATRFIIFDILPIIRKMAGRAQIHEACAGA